MKYKQVNYQIPSSKQWLSGSSLSSQRITRNYNELTENYINMKKEIETINKGQENMKNTISELKNTVEGIKSRLNEAEVWFSKLEDKVEKKHPERARKGKEAQKE